MKTTFEFKTLTDFTDYFCDEATCVSALHRDSFRQRRVLPALRPHGDLQIFQRQAVSLREVQTGFHHQDRHGVWRKQAAIAEMVYGDLPAFDHQQGDFIRATGQARWRDAKDGMVHGASDS